MYKYYSIYDFIGKLSGQLPKDCVVLADAGNTGFGVSQAIKLREGMRYITSGAQMDMGFALPASIGVACVTDNPVIAIIGDGSFQLNVQELTVIAFHKFPIKMFVINNNGYSCIRNMQKKSFDDNLIGTDSASGLSFPKTKDIAKAYGIEYHIWSPDDGIGYLTADCPIIAEVFTDPDEQIRSTLV